MNIRDIARKASVSTATVSRVLNGSPKVNPETRERILRIIEALNYVPNGVARSVSHGKTSILGLVLPDITNPFFPGIARGVEDTANSFGYKVILCNSDNERETEASYLRMLREQRVDGIILVGSSSFEEAQVRDIIHDVPLVWCDRAPEGGTYHAVLTDHALGTKLVASYLAELGHREIAMIAGPAISTSLVRQLAFQQAAKAAGLELPENRILPGRYDYTSGYRAMQEILHKDHVTAVYCANDLMAFGAMDAIRESGLKVPDDISVIGYDNIQFAEWSHPGLTTVAQPTYGLGMNAVHLLMDSIAGRSDKPIRRLLEPSLTIRSSTAKVNL